MPASAITMPVFAWLMFRLSPVGATHWRSFSPFNDTGVAGFLTRDCVPSTALPLLSSMKIAAASTGLLSGTPTGSESLLDPFC